MDKELQKLINKSMPKRYYGYKARIYTGVIAKLYAEQKVKNLSLSVVSKCACSVDETTGWTEVKCCNICGKPIKSENWHCC